MKRSEMVTQLTYNLGNRTNTSCVTANKIVWLNFALEDIACIRNWRDMKRTDFTTVKTRVGGSWYPWSSLNKCKDIIDFHYEDGAMSHSLVYKTPRLFSKMFPDLASSGSSYPTYYTYWGEYFRLFPTPSSGEKEIHIMGSFWPEPFDASEDKECPLSRLSEAVICMATAYGYRTLGDWEKYLLWQRDALNICKKHAQYDGDPSDWTPQWASQRLTNAVRNEGLVLPAETNVI